ncbi:hypothetical protein BDL97_02G018500 [Sphagnum fallax]|nr:hypothetical protein BDL97_02G018500 [Sphagnum fallax]
MDSVQEFISNCFDYAGIHNIPALISKPGHILGIHPDTTKSSSFPLLCYESSTGLLCRLKPLHQLESRFKFFGPNSFSVAILQSWG